MNIYTKLSEVKKEIGARQERSIIIAAYRRRSSVLSDYRRRNWRQSRE